MTDFRSWKRNILQYEQKHGPALVERRRFNRQLALVGGGGYNLKWAAHYQRFKEHKARKEAAAALKKSAGPCPVLAGACRRRRDCAWNTKKGQCLKKKEKE